MSRRSFLTATAGSLFATRLSLGAPAMEIRDSHEPIKPRRLAAGQTVGIVSPASATFDPTDVELAEARLGAVGLRSKRGRHVLDRRGYLAGTDRDRAEDVNRMFEDPDVDAILCLRGGWGSARILPLLDYDLIRSHAKLIFGFSDITSLLLAIYARSGVVTLHGPDGLVSWNAFATEYFRRVAFDAEPVRMVNPSHTGDDLVQTEDRVITITPGRATGRLAGGNLTVLTAIIGSSYLPDFTGHILFLEDVGEDVYRIDRMMTQLKLAGILDRIEGLVFGKCTRCGTDSGGYGSLTLHEVMNDHIAPLGIPAWYGAMIGHIRHRFSVPIGTLATIDADDGSIALQEPAVR